MTKQKGFVAIAILIAVLVLAGGGLGYMRHNEKVKEAKAQEEIKNSNQLSETASTEVQTQTTSPATATPKESVSATVKTSTEIQSPEMAFADKLNSCTKYKATFIHPFTREPIQKEILGVINGKCDYVEEMPNGGKMECKYSADERVAVSQYYKDLAVAESSETSLDAEGLTYKINGKVVANPLQEALDNNVCVISGY